MATKKKKKGALKTAIKAISKEAVKKKPKPKPEMMGTGMASRAGSAIVKRKQRNCAAMGGKWKGGKCVY